MNRIITRTVVALCLLSATVTAMGCDPAGRGFDAADDASAQATTATLALESIDGDRQMTAVEGEEAAAALIAIEAFGEHTRLVDQLADAGYAAVAQGVFDLRSADGDTVRAVVDAMVPSICAEGDCKVQAVTTLVDSFGPMTSYITDGHELLEIDDNVLASSELAGPTPQIAAPTTMAAFYSTPYGSSNGWVSLGCSAANATVGAGATAADGLCLVKSGIACLGKYRPIAQKAQYEQCVWSGEISCKIASANWNPGSVCP